MISYGEGLKIKAVFEEYSGHYDRLFALYEAHASNAAHTEALPNHCLLPISIEGFAANHRCIDHFGDISDMISGWERKLEEVLRG